MADAIYRILDFFSWRTWRLGSLFLPILLLLLTACAPSAAPTPQVHVQQLVAGQTANATLEAGAIHQWQFIGQAGDHILIQARGALAGLSLTLSGANVGVLAVGESIDTTLTAFDSYTVEVTALQGGLYEISLNYADQTSPSNLIVTPPALTAAAPTATPPLDAGLGRWLAELHPDAPRQGQFVTGDAAHIYTLAGGAGAYLTLTLLQVTAGLDPTLTLFAPDGAEIASDDNNGGGTVPLLRNIRLPADGLYRLRVSGRGGVGQYQIIARQTFQPIAVTPIYAFVTPIPRPTESLPTNSLPGLDRLLGGLADNLPQANAAQPGVRDWWSIYLQVGDVISAAVRSDDALFTPRLSMTAPDGLTLADVTAPAREALINSQAATRAGWYHLQVSNAQGYGGTYTLVWRYVALAATPTPATGTVQIMRYDDIASDQAYQLYTFQGEAGERVRIVVTATAGSALDAVADLLDAAGNVIAHGDDSEGDLNPRFEATLPADGTYTVRINGYLTSGAFTLTVAQVF